MHPKLYLLSLISTASFFLSPAAAANIEFHVAYSCASFASWTINNAPSNQCYWSDINMGAVRFVSIPSGAKGQAYHGASSACTNYVGERGAGTQCLIAGSNPIRSANWFYPWKKLVRKDEIEPLEPVRYSVTFGTSDLTTREVEVPAAEINRAVKLLVEKNFEELAKYPIVSQSLGVVSKKAVLWAIQDT